MILTIDTSDGKNIFIAFIDKDGIIKAKKQFTARYQQAEKLLPAIESLKKTIKLPLAKIKGLVVVSGPGPFTALRIGITVANTIASTLKIPIVGIRSTKFKSIQELVVLGLTQLETTKTFKIIEPYYNQKPNITVKKR